MEEYTDRVRSIVTLDGWKLTINDASQGELYPLKTDPKERRNLFYQEQQLERIKELVQKIREWQRKTEDELIEFDGEAWKRHRKQFGTAK